MALRTKKPGKPKKVSYELIARESLVGFPMYALLNELVWVHHEDVRDARIVLAWCTSWKPDVDGRVILGKCRKASDLDRELAAFDFVILLSRSFWNDLRVTAEQRRALLDHELCHAARQHDAKGEPVFDERDRPVFRLRKHDIEEFTAVVERHGTYKADLERFAAALRRSGLPAHEPCAACATNVGWVTVKDEHNIERLVRCQCWLAWSQLRRDMHVA